MMFTILNCSGTRLVIALCVATTLVGFAGCQQDAARKSADPSSNNSSESASPSAMQESGNSRVADAGPDGATSQSGAKSQTDADPPEPGLANNPNPSFYEDPTQTEPEEEVQTIQIPEQWVRLGKNEIWVDKQNKQVITAGRICLDMGPLEMFVCPFNTKEHESVIAVNAQAREVHFALVALGFNPGEPCTWNPEYKPAYGPEIKVDVRWLDEDTKQEITRAGKSMIRHSDTGKPMTQSWVFGGSQIWKDPETGEAIYYGDSGELICLSNFSTATIDVNVESSASTEGLLFDAHTENIPPIGTKVYVIIKPGETIGKPEPDTTEPSPDSTEAPPTDGETPPDQPGVDDPKENSEQESSNAAGQKEAAEGAGKGSAESSKDNLK